MVRLHPETPTFPTGSEREVWERLRDGLGEEDVLIANLRLTDEDKDHEADLRRADAGRRRLVLEVKGGSVWYDARAGGHSATAVRSSASTRSTRPATPSTPCASTSSADPRWGSARGWRGRTVW